MLNRNQLHRYQVQGVEHIKNNPECALFLDMGLGKTVTTLTAVADLIEYFEVTKVLIVAPKRVSEVTWGDEIENWSHLRNLRISVIAGTPKQRVAAAHADADIYTIGRDNLVWLLEHFGGVKVPYDCIVVDELSSFKNHASERFKAMKKIRRHANRIIGLTGTPAPNGLIDLWAQMFVIDGGVRLGKSITDYRANYFKPGAQNGGIVFNYKPREDTEQVLSDKIADITLSMKAVDYLDMPEVNYIYDKVTLSPKELAKYKEFEKEQILSMFADGDETEITALSAAALSNKLLQFAGGAVYDAERNIHQVSEAKIESLCEMVESLNGAPVLIAYNFRHEAARIEKALAKLKPVRIGGDSKGDGNQIMRDWNAGKVKVLIAHPASVGHGLNLQKGGNNIIWFGVTWNLELYQQFNARLWRQGQTKPVFIHHLCAKGTIDERVVSAIQGKSDTQNKLIDAIKEIVSKYIR